MTAKALKPQLLPCSESVKYHFFMPSGAEPYDGELSEASDARHLGLIEQERQECIQMGHRPIGYLFHLPLMTKGKALETLLRWPITEWRGYADEINAILNHIGLAALDSMTAYVQRKPIALPGLLGVDSPRIVPLTAHAFTNLKLQRDNAKEWLHKHPETAAVGLIPELYERSKKKRTAVITTLRYLARSKRELLLDVATRYGEVAVTLLKEALAPRRQSDEERQGKV